MKGATMLWILFFVFMVAQVRAQLADTQETCELYLRSPNTPGFTELCYGDTEMNGDYVMSTAPFGNQSVPMEVPLKHKSGLLDLGGLFAPTQDFFKKIVEVGRTQWPCISVDNPKCESNPGCKPCGIYVQSEERAICLIETSHAKLCPFFTELFERVHLLPFVPPESIDVVWPRYENISEYIAETPNKSAIAKNEDIYHPDYSPPSGSDVIPSDNKNDASSTVSALTSIAFMTLALGLSMYIMV